MRVHRFQRQAARHGSEFVSSTDSLLSKSCFKDFSYRWDKAGPTRQEDHIDIVGQNPGGRQEGIDALFNLPKLFRNPFLKGRSLNRNLEINKTVGKLEYGTRSVRQVALHLLYRAMELKS